MANQPQESHPPHKALRLALHGEDLLTSPRFNKGTAFTLDERGAFGLEGRLPHRVNTLEEQCKRAYEQLKSKQTALHKNTFLQSLKAQNWTLYYALLSRNLSELVPIIYTPTEVKYFSLSQVLVAQYFFFRRRPCPDTHIYSGGVRAYS
jgi:malate dehydrogenase (oxaloacetate-decarboxylating)